MKLIVSALVLLFLSPGSLFAQLTPEEVRLFFIRPGSAHATLYFPQIAAGSQWQTSFTLANPHFSNVSGYIQFFDDSGEPLQLDFGSGPVSRFSFEIPRGESREFISVEARPDVRVGWASLTATASIQGVATYRFIRDGALQFEVSVPGTLPTISYFSSATPSLGIAVGNAYNNLSISLRLLAIGNGGSFSGNFTLPPRGHRALFLADAIPGLPQDFQGTVRITEEGDKDFTALTLRSRGGVFSSLPSGEAARPLSHYEVIRDAFTDLLEAVILFELIPDPTSIELAISYDFEIQAYGGRDGIQINIALAELLSDSESELAFIIGHELGHVYQYRTGKQDFHAANDELDADGWGLVLSLFAGYDPYAGAGALAKLEMAHGQADLDSQYLQEITDSHGSFNNRLDFIYDTIVEICSDESLEDFCSSYKSIFRPNSPTRLLTIRP